MSTLSQFFGSLGRNSLVVPCEIVLVGGGGGTPTASGAPFNASGGGGGGGVVQGNFNLTRGVTYLITVGGGGSGGVAAPGTPTGTPGTSSNITFPFRFGSGTYVQLLCDPSGGGFSNGGGAGGANANPGSPAGGGGGGGGFKGTTPGTTTTGGNGLQNTNTVSYVTTSSEGYGMMAFPGSGSPGLIPSATGLAGGGGGAGGAAVTPTGAGGAGLSVTISGASETYGAGGSSRPLSTLPPVVGVFPGVAGGANTGNGGGGAASTAPPVFPGGNTGAGANGGSGVVIIAYPDTFPEASSVVGTYTQPSRSGWRVYKFLSSGSITI